jgi:ribosome-binding protein aMBF1 (putative translation factor)
MLSGANVEGKEVVMKKFATVIMVCAACYLQAETNLRTYRTQTDLSPQVKAKILEQEMKLHLKAQKALTDSPTINQEIKDIVLTQIDLMQVVKTTSDPGLLGAINIAYADLQKCLDQLQGGQK